jgi:hypothetical protein
MANKGMKPKGMYESPQVARDGISTAVKGGKDPSKEDIIKSANARGGKRHEMKGDRYSDINVLPNSAHMAGNEMVGIKDSGYLTKKGLVEGGANVMLHSLPPGMDIEDQENADIRKMPMKTITAMGYPGDGWTDGEDLGRPGQTNT